MMVTTRKMSYSAVLISLAALVAATFLLQSTVDCAPASTGNNSNNSNTSRPRVGLLSSLFRRQTGSSSGELSTASSNESTELEDPQTQTELDAQKFMDSLPNVGPTNNGPTTFRERVSETFGLLRDGWSNHFRSVRDNFSDTVDDLRETWSSNSE